MGRGIVPSGGEKEEEILDVGSSQGSWSMFRDQCFSSVVDYGVHFK